MYLYFNAVKIQYRSFLVIVDPAGKPTHFKSFNSDKIWPRLGHLSAFGNLQYFSSIGPRLYWRVLRSQKYNCCYIILHYDYIDVAYVIAIAMDIWGDCRASACNPTFMSILLCALELRFCSLATAADSVCVLVTIGPTVIEQTPLPYMPNI